jgi:hypothetical protein
MAVDARDEGLHPAGDDAAWQESAYLAWRDPKSGFGGNHRLGNEANRDAANLWCGVYHESGTRFRHNDEDLALERVEHGMIAGPQRIFHDGERLRFALDGRGCTLDLEIVDDDDTLTLTDGKAFAGTKGAAGAIFSNNFHASCRVRGTVTLDDRTAPIDAPAWRDHSWGVRDWSSFLASRSFGGALGPYTFRYGSMVGTNGSFFRHGSVARDGEALDLASVEMLVHLDDDSIRCPAAEVRYRLASGDTVLARIDIIGSMIGSTRERFGWESVGDLTVAGEPGVGWGFLEVNNNPRNGTQPPAFVLADALTNGVTHLAP